MQELQKRLLQHILGILVVPEHDYREAIDRLPVLVEERAWEARAALSGTGFVSPSRLSEV